MLKLRRLNGPEAARNVHHAVWVPRLGHQADPRQDRHRVHGNNGRESRQVRAAARVVRHLVAFGAACSLNLRRALRRVALSV